jgi:hypothetical protein
LRRSTARLAPPQRAAGRAPIQEFEMRTGGVGIIGVIVIVVVILFLVGVIKI